ncbi:MAG: Gfo/Idh/MocA family oxidoreductase [Clostridia bacterium]|nr:Gfo/Idh/MocA family oxidoreductase [Clostridia bacterium]
MTKVKVMLAGIGGYGDLYLRRLLDMKDEEVSVEGLVEPFPQSCTRLAEIETKGWKIYPTLDEFYAERSCDVAVIATPIQFHTKHILTALSHGSNVLCEKPLTGDVRDIETLTEARDKAGKFVMIGFQWSHSKAILDMKKDVLAGVYGKPEFLKTLVLWPRNKAYYNRGSGWAGKLRGSDGTLILDSVAHNATAHYLHNIFFTLGGALNESLEPTEMKAELLRANPIENFDTALISCTFKNGAKSLYIASHAIDKTLNPVFEYRFEKGVITFDEGSGKRIVGKLADGSVRDYGDPFADQMNKLDIAIANAKGGEQFIPCGIETASAEVCCVTECAKLPIVNFSEDKKRLGSNELTYVEGLYDALVDCYSGEHLLADAGYQA